MSHAAHNFYFWAISLLRFDVMAPNVPDAQAVKKYDKNHSATDVCGQVHCEVRIVGAHSPAHERVGKDIIVPGRGGGKSGESAEECHADRDGEASDHERQKALHRAYSRTAKDAAGEPFDQVGRNGFGETDIQAAYHIEDTEPAQCEKCDDGAHGDLVKYKPPDRGIDQYHIPVRATVFQPPQITCVDADERRHEKEAEEQGVLRPQ